MLGWGAAYVALVVVVALLTASARGVSGLFPPFLRGMALRLTVALVLLLPVIVVPVWLVVTRLPIAPEFRTGAVTGTLIATGWIVAFILREYETARARNQTRVDVLVALQQEVFSCLERFDERPIRADAATAQQSITDGGDDPATTYHPLPSSESPPTVFDAVKADIKVIDPDTLEEVLRFYAAYSDLRAFIDDFRSEAFRAMPAARRVGAHEVLTKRREAALVWAIKAMVSINVALGTPNPGRIARSGQNPDITVEPTA